METTFKINEKFKTLINPPTDEEKQILEDAIVKDGVRHPLTVWKEENTLIDGHTRFEICQRLNIEYKTEEMSFADEDHVMSWMANNQLGRRNITKLQKDYLMGLRYEAEKKIHGGQGGNRFTKKEIIESDNYDHSLTEPESNNTSKKLAKEYGVGEATPRLNFNFVKNIGTLSEVISPEVKTEILSGKVKISKSRLNDLALVAQSDPEEAKKQYEEAKMGKKKVKKEKNNVVQLAPKQDTAAVAVQEENHQEDVREVDFTCPICGWVEDGTYIFSGVTYKHPQSFMKELKNAIPATESLSIVHSSISRMKAMMPDDPDRIPAYEEMIAWCQSAIEEAKQHQLKLKKQARR